ncbi:glycosyltransferase family 4 protein [Caloramator australicus]|uniref:Capsular polysaccharide biosynthesis protein n=1 Tax=Caloramator australicus RC3 TaxID=857293 RepID=G0V439_9CLOT|nr:glycosyltransferase family 4 protein [Caloramator australicus]CCC57879.1 capsular polysaccharide biosynthesis protein [Caloramator australicus RC3]
MAKVLVTVHLGRHFRIFGHYDYKVLLDMGHEVHIAANFNDTIDKFDDKRVIKHQIDFDRNPFSLANIKAYRQLKELFKRYRFDLIHTQSPSGGAVTRLAAIEERKKGTKVIYTAHGFHFYKGASLKNWILYYNIEKFLGCFTDCVITINKEDYDFAKKNFKENKVKYIPGVGIDLNKFIPQNIENKIKLRKQYGYDENDFILIYVAEMSYRKHQDLLINVTNLLKTKIPNLKLLLVGKGKLLEKYKEQTKKLNLEKYIHFLGYRKDVPDLMTIADVAVSSSRQEGLPVNIMEAMATGLPLVVTNCRGNRDLITNGENGYVVGIDDVGEFANAIEKIYKEDELRRKFGKKNLENIKMYSIENVKKEMERIYNSYI